MHQESGLVWVGMDAPAFPLSIFSPLEAVVLTLCLGPKRDSKCKGNEEENLLTEPETCLWTQQTLACFPGKNMNQRVIFQQHPQTETLCQEWTLKEDWQENSTK